jgi:membrane fusion protein, heavy metal efflux system
MPRHLRFFLRCARAAATCIVGAALVLLHPAAVRAHEGHDHGAAPATATAPGSPRVVATSERYEFVGIVEGEVLVIYLDRAGDNSPVTSATMEVSLDGETFVAEPQEKSGTYEITAPLLRRPGSHEVLVNLRDGEVDDLLAGTLIIVAPQEAAGGARALLHVARDALAAIPGGRIAALGAGLLLIAAAAVGAASLRRRKLVLAPAVILILAMTSTVVWAHEGHDHGPDLSASSGNSPSRRPDGSIFVPKPTQRLLEIRTQVTATETKVKTVRFNGRVVANPNRSGVVQSTLQGRYEAPEGGVPPLGTKVKAGDPMGRVAPSFASIDSSDMAQTLGTLDQEISLSRRKLARQEQLLATNAVARAAVEDVRIQLEGLEQRRRELLAAKVRPEELRAPVDGVIAAARVVAGQVVAPSDQLFQIIDPASLLVEALVFDQINPDAVEEATASLGNDAAIRLRFLGRSRALQQQYSILQFQIVATQAALNVGTPLTVIASAGDRVTGIVLPRAALATAPNGQIVVFAHKEPEVFMPRAVRAEPLDSDSVVVTGGLSAGEKIVVRNAPLLNQVR